jgi:hypothetical protein
MASPIINILFLVIYLFLTFKLIKIQIKVIMVMYCFVKKIFPVILTKEKIEIKDMQSKPSQVMLH